MEESLRDQAVTQWERGELDRALELLAEHERICRDEGDPERVAESLATQSQVLRHRGDDADAEGKLREALDVAPTGDDSTLVGWIRATSLASHGLVLRDRGDDAGAEGKLGEALEIARAAGHSALVEQIERRLSEDVGDPAGFHAALDQLHRARERLAEIFREGRERDRRLYDERETGLEGPSGLGGTPFDDR